ncbi:hypothetical protein FACS1894151_01980 [Spirochaetia bacterium]|nr:hypothetical protein FACS1894151_01980 [Spirochaetia bacterium]
MGETLTFVFPVLMVQLSMALILIAEDEVLTREGIRDHIDWQELGIDTVLTARNGMEAIDILKDRRADILLTDVRMPRMNGMDLSAIIRKRFPDCAIIFLSGYSGEAYLRSAITVKAEQYVKKPVNIDELTGLLKTVMGDIREREKARQQAALSSRTALGLLLTIKQTERSEILTAMEGAGFKEFVSCPLTCLLINTDSSGIHSLQENIISLFDLNDLPSLVYTISENTVVCFLFSPAGKFEYFYCSPDTC